MQNIRIVDIIRYMAKYGNEYIMYVTDIIKALGDGNGVRIVSRFRLELLKGGNYDKVKTQPDN